MNRSRRLLSGFWIFAGTMHFVVPRTYEAIVPEYVPMTAQQAVSWSGVAEIVGGVTAAPSPTRRFARWWLLGVLVAVFPANVHMAVSPEKIPGLRIPRWALWLRLPIQPLFMLWAWRATE